jgi:hypothetical protein
MRQQTGDDEVLVKKVSPVVGEFGGKQRLRIDGTCQ